MTSSKSVPAILQQPQDKEPQGTRRGAIIWQYGALEEGTIIAYNYVFKKGRIRLWLRPT